MGGTGNRSRDRRRVHIHSFGLFLEFRLHQQQSALKNWGKDQEDILNTQKIFSQRSKMNGLASTGQWLEELETK